MASFHNDTFPESLKRRWPFGDEEMSSPATSSFSTTTTVQDSGGISRTRAQGDTLFGCLVGVTAQLCNRSSALQQVSQPKGLPKSFPVIQDGSYFSLEDCGNRFARLNKTTCSNLYALVTCRQVYLRAFIQDEAWKLVLGSSPYGQKAPFQVEINVYGFQADAEEIGRTLSKNGAFLQFPRYGLEDIEYHNPHLLRIEGYADRDRIEIPDSFEEDIQEKSNKLEEDDPQVDSSKVVDSILGSLSHHQLLLEISIDRRIKSCLLPHQKEAIDFIFCRELKRLPSELSLWKKNEIDTDEPFYQHIFTGAKRPQEDEAKGGIIADEMGLGKTLVILSTIASSMDRAGEFVASESNLVSNHPQMKTPSRATLILAPSSLLIDSWIDEIRKHTYTGGLSFHKHLGPGRHAETNLLHERTIVFTTYATVATEFSRSDHTLAKINWFRIVLDEAHDIRNPSTKQFQALVRLSAHHRWCLTGTPIQNSLDDLGALVSFLKVPILENAPTFRKFITNPIMLASKGRYQNLRTLLQTICLRRTRDTLDLPEPEVLTRQVCLTSSEQLEYRELSLKCKRQIDMAVSGRRKAKVNSTVLESLLKLRLFCNNGVSDTILQRGPKGFTMDPDVVLTYLQQLEQNICAYCSGIIYSISNATETDGGTLIPDCYHVVCHSCMPHRRSDKRCPTCASGVGPTIPALLTSKSLDPQIRPGSYMNDDNAAQPERFPSKLLELLSDIRKNASHRSIVFSCWKKTLDLVGKLLSNHGIRYNMIDGSLRLSDRVKLLDNFRSTGGARILLMTLGTGAVGLNLAVASRIYLLEPQWNPFIESQAMGRALRLGQTNQVVIVRYITKNTIEESNVLGRQNTKLQLAGGGFGKGKNAQSERLQSVLDVFGTDESSGFLSDHTIENNSSIRQEQDINSMIGNNWNDTTQVDTDLVFGQYVGDIQPYSEDHYGQSVDITFDGMMESFQPQFEDYVQSTGINFEGQVDGFQPNLEGFYSQPSSIDFSTTFPAAGVPR